MNSSIKGGIWKVIATIAISVVVLYAASFLLRYYSKTYPQLITYHYLSYIQDAIAAVIAVGLAIGGIVIGFAVQSIASSILSGIMILTTAIARPTAITAAIASWI